MDPKVITVYTDRWWTLFWVFLTVPVGAMAGRYRYTFKQPGIKPDGVHPGSYYGWGHPWTNVLVNETPGTLYAYWVERPDSNIRGCCYKNGASVQVLPIDGLIGLRNRIVHELCHADGLDADGMERNATQWVPPETLGEFWATKEERRDAWEWKYYQWLLATLP